MPDMAEVSRINSLGKYALNPRGNLWLNDENRFGAKIMSKMGWSKGKGLGKNEDGNTENIKVKQKHTNSGVGWNEKFSESSVTAEIEEYESLLSRLNEGYLSAESSKNCVINKGEDKGLEQRSQKFRNRLHYQKFVRGKDVSRYSDEDMKSIFISKKHMDEQQSAEKDTNDVMKSSYAVDMESTTYKSHMNVTDYFAKKLEAKLKKGIAKNPDSVVLEGQGITLLSAYKVDDSFSKEELKRSSKKRKRSKEEDSFFQDEEDLSSVKEKEEPCKKKKKSSKLSKKLKHEIYTSLKSCLKNEKSLNFSNKKEVSFSDTVSYRIFESELSESDTEEEIIEPKNCKSEEIINPDNCNSEEIIEPKNCNMEEITELKKCNKNEIVELKNCNSEEILEPKNCNDEQMLNEDKALCTKNNETSSEIDVPDEKSIKEYECFSLPRSKYSNYDSWRDSQRQAMKMSVYITMMKKFRRHPILKTTNLLDIKGYGNWGF